MKRLLINKESVVFDITPLNLLNIKKDDIWSL